jgi:predicted NUDIX family phosphoesterase
MDAAERVGVVPRELAEDLGLLGHGFTPAGRGDALARLERAIRFLDRAPAEDDPGHKQLIPYAVVCRAASVLAVERLAGGGEARLHGKLSIGIGGHINPVDERAPRLDTGAAAIDAPAGLVLETLWRELREELDMAGIARVAVRGFLNDDTQPVGRVHLGIVFRVDLGPDGWARVRETHALAGGFRPWDEVAGLRPRLETWSAFVLDAQQRGQLD